MKSQRQTAGYLSRCLGIALALCVGVAAPWMVGCDDSASRADCAPDCSAVDGGPVPAATDASRLPFADGGLSADGSVPGLLSEADDPAACLDGFDNDSAGGADCSDRSCATSPACCVGAGSEACCAASTPVDMVGIGGCADGPAAGCAALATAIGFGSPAPRIDSGGLVPGGTESMESGMILRRGVEVATARVVIEADIASPIGCATCVDGLRVSLAEYVPGAAQTHAYVGLLVSGTRGDASLIIGDTIVARQPLPNDASHRYTLALDPDGSVRLTSDFMDLRGSAVPTGAALDLMVHGSAANRSSESSPPARLSGLTLSTSVCDLPAALSVGGNALISDLRFRDSARSPSAAQHPMISGTPGRRMAFMSGADVWLAHGRMDGTYGVSVTTPALTGTATWAPGGVGDPDLYVVPGETRWGLVLTARDAEGVPSIVTVMASAGYDEQFTSAPMTLLGPQVDPSGGAAFVGFDGGSMFVDGATRYLVARGLREDGTVSLVLAQFTSDTWALSPVCGTNGGCPDLDTATQRSVHQPRVMSSVAFDRDEVANPVMFRHNGVYRLYYAGRRGTRWSIGVLISTNLRTFVPAMEGDAVLGATGEGYRALGASDPALFVDGQTLSIFHTGIDGVRQRVGVSRQTLR